MQPRAATCVLVVKFHDFLVNFRSTFYQNSHLLEKT